ncbi:hypothetical protein [Aliikangiella sp. IMCC44359]|uniref:hypothetical protein n=1 Tax=Aliikangiella sp. IMCC44359 TaxID=3459125 RepID=UPI00403A9BB7
MRKLLICLAVGLAVTSLSIVYRSNIAILIIMSIFILAPLTMIVTKIVKRNFNLAQSLIEKKSSALNIVSSLGKHAMNSRRVRMQNEAKDLQLELEKINQINDQIEKLLRMGQWKIKADIHHELYSDLNTEPYVNYSEDFKSELGLLINKTG